jgi:cytochrome c554/c'-like protein
MIGPRAALSACALVVSWTFACLLTLIVVLSAQTPVQMTTAERVEGVRWWPTKTNTTPSDYVGAAACIQCHKSKASQEQTAMARTATRAENSAVLKRRQILTFSGGPNVHEIKTENGKSLYSVSDGKSTTSTPLQWAFGVGKVGQTYVFERDGRMYEGRASYFATIDALDFTPSRTIDRPADGEPAMGRLLSSTETRRCFSCHTTVFSTRPPSSVVDVVPGVTCEACHGPGRIHVEAMRKDKEEQGLAAIVNPAPFNPIDSVDFCGACHATYWDVTLAGEKGISALRSQPFRLQSSRCWGDGDRRITCVACHNPHEPLERDARVYDERCLTCHRAADAAAAPARPTTNVIGASSPHAPACRARAREQCASCHMPKYKVPQMHFSFTDHLIRVVRAAE